MRERIDIQKVARYSIVVNAMQILAVSALAASLLMGELQRINPGLLRLLVVAAAGLVCWGAVVDIREALSTIKMRQQALALEEAHAQLENLNRTLRAQRHDFLNHLQVVYSLIEMQEEQEALDYLSRVHGDLQQVSRVMRTDNPSLNALLQAKLTDCEKRGIKVELAITSPWQRLPVPGWEMCRVLGNLIDNAMDALEGQAEPSLTIALLEDVKTFRFRVENTGPEIPEAVRARLFQPGYTTKPHGQGMGLHIVEDIVRRYGGDIGVTSDARHTAFEGSLPKAVEAAQAAHKKRQLT